MTFRSRRVELSKATEWEVDLKTGWSGSRRVPDGGPHLSDAEIQEIVDQIDAGCPNDPAT